MFLGIWAKDMFLNILIAYKLLIIWDFESSDWTLQSKAYRPLLEIQLKISFIIINETIQNLRFICGHVYDLEFYKS